MGLPYPTPNRTPGLDCARMLGYSMQYMSVGRVAQNSIRPFRSKLRAVELGARGVPRLPRYSSGERTECEVPG